MAAAALVWLVASGCDGDAPRSTESPRSPAAEPAESARSAASSLDAVIERARELVAAERTREARSYLQGQLSRFQGDALRRLYSLRARLSLRSGRESDALELADTIAKRFDDAVEAAVVRGEALRQLARFEEAAEILETAIDSGRAPHWSLVSLARAKYRLHEGEAAVSLFERYFSSRSAGDDAGALEQENLLTPIDADRHELRLEYGRALVTAGRLQDAADVFAELLVESPLESALYSELARTQFRLGRRETGQFLQQVYGVVSQKDYDKLIEERLIDTGNLAFGLSQRAINLFNAKRFLQALEVYRKNIALEQPDARAHRYYAQSLLRLQRPGDALAVVENAMEKDLRPLSGILAEKGLAHHQREEHELAEKALARAWQALEAEGDAGGVEKGQVNGARLASMRLENLLDARASISEIDARLREARSAGLPAAELAYFRVRSLRQEGRTGEALQALQQAGREALAASPRLAVESVYLLAEQNALEPARKQALAIIQQHGGLDAAYEALEQIVERGAELEPALARGLAERRKLLDAWKLVRKQIDAAPLDRDAAPLYVRFGDLARRLQHGGEAIDALILGIELDPTRPEAYPPILQGLRRNEDIFLRLRYLEMAVQADPDRADYREALARIYLTLGVRLEAARDAASWLVEHGGGETAEELLRQIDTRLSGEAPSSRPTDNGSSSPASPSPGNGASDGEDSAPNAGPDPDGTG